MLFAIYKGMKVNYNTIFIRGMVSNYSNACGMMNSELYLKETVMKQAILVVAFGSTVDSAREHQIDAVVNRIKEKYTDYEVRLAFSSRIVVKRLRDRGIEIPTEQGALDIQIFMYNHCTSLVVKNLIS